ncbi:S-adenosyl-L-methionine-dependent methyltransferase [Multifurca ochricompacta]|uniref:Ubiquinone biosynthesis O-methyltransferase, mitochondrial n=1 Tax=Multifurca ochricompacta TaxID=376703 RepID=A0AAD4QJ57_9AGAM|nr:S-adenosyl-L-methionine-dependent methyltransferase [Multifurca ochricompacta]
MPRPFLSDALPRNVRCAHSIIANLRAFANPNRYSSALHTAPPPPLPQNGTAHPHPHPRISTVNDEEIAHFSRLSKLWWDERGEFTLLHKMNPHRMRFIREKVLEVLREDDRNDDAVALRMRDSNRLLNGLDVLDVGCGGGILSESLARLGANTLAIDASAENIHIASQHAAADPGLSSLSFRHTSAETLLQEESKKRFDIVCSMEVVEHVNNPAAFLRSCAELVKPGGHLFLSTIARTPLSYLLTIVAAEKVFRLVEPGTHTFSKFINPDELIGFFTKPLNEGGRPWISRTYAYGLPTRVEAEVRGIVYVPWRGDWVLAPRATTPLSTQANYLFWIRRPKENV